MFTGDMEPLTHGHLFSLFTTLPLIYMLWPGPDYFKKRMKVEEERNKKEREKRSYQEPTPMGEFIKVIKQYRSLSFLCGLYLILPYFDFSRPIEDLILSSLSMVVVAGFLIEAQYSIETSLKRYKQDKEKGDVQEMS